MSGLSQGIFVYATLEHWAQPHMLLVPQERIQHMSPDTSWLSQGPVSAEPDSGEGQHDTVTFC